MLVKYTFTEPIHTFTFHANTRQAADEYMTLAEQAIVQWIEAGKTDDPFCILLDISKSGLFPLKYTINRSSSLLDAHEVLPQRYIAYLTDNALDISLLKDIATTPQWNNTRRIFSPSERESAEAWLAAI